MLYDLLRRLRRRDSWDGGNDIYGVRRGEMISPRDDEGRLDHLDTNMGVTRSGFYHAYWEGWTEYRIPREDGKQGPICRVYTAPWLRLAGSRWRRAVYGALLASAAAAFCFAMTRRVGSNSCRYVALFGMPTGILMLAAAWFCLLAAKAPRDLTRWEYRCASVYLRRASLAFAVGLALTAAATGVYLALHPQDPPAANALNIALELLAAAASAAVFLLERRAVYLTVENDTPAPENGRVIR